MTTKAFKQAVRRNIDRFPNDFMFELSEKEYKSLRSQIATSRSQHGGRRHLPTAFTEHGVAMLSGILTSKRAVAINIQIVRAFIRMRDMMLDNDDLRRKIEALEKHYDEQLKIVFNALRRMFEEDENRPEIGYRDKDET